MSTDKSYAEMRDELLRSAANDQDFRARLTSDPKGAIEEALGVTVPETMSIEVHEDSATTAHLVLPPAAALNEGELSAIAAGHAASYGTKHRHRPTDEWTTYQG